MKKCLPLFFIYFFFGATSLSGQTDFRKGYEDADPVSSSSEITMEEKLATHKAFLDKALQGNDSLQQLYGLLYVFIDYVKLEDYAEASPYLIKAKQLAEKSGKAGWKGWVSYRGAILSIRMDKQEEEAIPAYEEAVKFCSEAGDSLCLGESWEQLSAMHGLFGEYEKAHRYFELALPVLEKYGSKKHITSAVSNYGGLLAMEGKYREAIPYIERAIVMSHEIEKYVGEGKAMNNLAVTYSRLGQFDKAIETYKKALRFNTEHGFSENRIRNYMGLYLTYKDKGNYQLANEALINRYHLKDSLIGIETQTKIAELEAKYESERLEAELQRNELKLVEAQRSLERSTILFILAITSIILLLWRWRRQARQTKQKLAENQENLLNLTKVLLEKNTLIASLEKQKSEAGSRQNPSDQSSILKENLYDYHILTKADWTKFKVLFEKTYPGYISRLRTSCPSLSEAEERLFLFIKLNLTSQEAASILGISAEGVKKTRYRLRKLLELAETSSLEEYIKEF